MRGKERVYSEEASSISNFFLLRDRDICQKEIANLTIIILYLKVIYSSNIILGITMMGVSFKFRAIRILKIVKKIIESIGIWINLELYYL